MSRTFLDIMFTKQVLYNIVIISFLFYLSSCHTNSNKDLIKLEITSTERGYGYNIYINNTLKIKQPFIPGVSGDIPFKTSKEAEKIGKKVLEKIKNGENPVITSEDLKEANIQYNP